MIKNLPQIVLLNIVGLALFLSGIFPLIMDSGCQLMRIFLFL
ncbi:Lipid A 1-diphosphate synthase [Escherichia coli]|nr:Lipid A 1-diphosphate synthase [Escherichia coli]